MRVRSQPQMNPALRPRGSVANRERNPHERGLLVPGCAHTAEHAASFCGFALGMLSLVHNDKTICGWLPAHPGGRYQKQLH